MEEIWKDIPEYVGLYQASNFGRIRSLDRIDIVGRMIKGKVIIPQKTKDRHLRVGLWKNGIRNRFYVHRLIWEAFNGQIPEGIQVNHIDENPENNNLDNLNLMTPKENVNWGTRNERAGEILKRNQKTSKKVFQFDKRGVLIATWNSAKEIERRLGYNNGNISNACSGRRKTAYGCIWRHTETI